MVSAVRPLRVIVKERLRVLERTQEWLAEQLGTHGSNLSAVLTGNREPPVDEVARWAAALGLEGREADELAAAMHLAAATPYVRDLVERQDRELGELREALARYRDRVGTARFVLDHVEAGAPPDVAELDLVALADCLREAVRARNARVHGLDRPEPRGSSPAG